MFRQIFFGRYFIGKDLFRIKKLIRQKKFDKKILDKYHKDKNYLDTYYLDLKIRKCAKCIHWCKKQRQF